MSARRRWAAGVSALVAWPLSACGGRVVLADADAGLDAISGVLVAAGAEDPFIAADDEGGAFIAYSFGSGCSQLFVQHMSGEGERLWLPDGVLVGAECT